MEKQAYLDELGYDYASVGYGSLSVNRDADGDPLSLYADGEEKEYEHGFFAHAYSVLVFEGLQTRGFTRFTATVGIHKTARVNNTQASVVFKVLVDNREEYVSELFGAYTEEDSVNGYYYGQDNLSVYRRAETEVAKWFASLTYDMTDAQLLYPVQNAYRVSITYDNVNYADGFYGAFIAKKCICSGYSKGFEYLAQRLGIRSAYVVGTAGGAHAWNYLYADGGWYMTDTTWGSADSYGLLGKADMDRAGRYDYRNYGRMPALEQERYDLSLMRYPLMSVGDAVMIRVGEKFDPAALVSVPASVAEKVPVVSVHYKGKVDTAKKGNYTVEVTAENSLGNVAKGTCEVSVYEKTDKLSSLVPVQTGNSNYAFRTVSLYAGGAEREFSDGLYTKANGTFSPAFDISGMGYTHFSANVGVDKVIRDNVPWGSYANATVRVYADGELLYECKNIGWKTDYASFAVRLPDGARTLTLEVTDTTGQGGVGWGDCLLYR